MTGTIPKTANEQNICRHDDGAQCEGWPARGAGQQAARLTVRALQRLLMLSSLSGLLVRDELLRPCPSHPAAKAALGAA